MAVQPTPGARRNGSVRRGQSGRRLRAKTPLIGWFLGRLELSTPARRGHRVEKMVKSARRGAWLPTAGAALAHPQLVTDGGMRASYTQTVGGDKWGKC
jgi:hypothetical protein